MKRFICIHGHFYQPPRENPWLNCIEEQPSAAPYHDWNERITAECYRPNAMARLLDRQGHIDRLINNYARMSFDVGPTLMIWLARHAPDVHEAIIAADQLAIRQWGGGAAMAQAHGHLILPLANERDRRTQVRWGIRDFELRFGRRPKGMWLPETACDTLTLEILAEEGIEFTVLAPSQAQRARSKKEQAWIDVRGGKIDPRRPYRVHLPSGRSIVVFFYEASVSRAVAFERLLDNGEAFAERLLALFDSSSDEIQLVHIATDGETYGHHHRFGEMALAYATEMIQREGRAQLTNYEAFLAMNPPIGEAEIIDGTSWSCAHGIERWRRHCGCSTGAHPGWSQAWREPLRQALETLRDAVELHFERDAPSIFRDPETARDAYVEVVAAQTPEALAQAQNAFIQSHLRPTLLTQSGGLGESPHITRALQLMEINRYAMAMFTSCAWFFDDISGIETLQVLAYARRVIELAQDLWQIDLEPDFLATLSRARSNIPEQGTGSDLYVRHVLPRSVPLERAAAHFAVASLFNLEHSPAENVAFSHRFEERESHTSGRAQLVLGTIAITSCATREHNRFVFAVLHLGDHHLLIGIRPDLGPEEKKALFYELTRAFDEAELSQMLRVFESSFAPQATSTPFVKAHLYSLRSLFKDEQKRILEIVLASTLDEVEREYASIYERHAGLIRYLVGLGQSVPRLLADATHNTLLGRLRRELKKAPLIDFHRLEALLREARETGALRGWEERHGWQPSARGDTDLLETVARQALRRVIDNLLAAPSLEALAFAEQLARFLTKMGVSIDGEFIREKAVLLRDRLLAQEAPHTWQAELRKLLVVLRITLPPSLHQ
ncbi:MAG: DUF3536 domain-containing protein [Sandaracinaceae bacterium]|nr:DUF3536 domain-containing protein [Sandaracinaceae bacterium]